MSRFTIYLHRNRITDKAYVGQTRQSVARRWREHVKNSIRVGRGCRVLSAAILKYGVEAFDHEILEVLPTQAEADVAEAMWIERLRTLVPDGYNLDSGRFCGSGRSFHHSEESKRLMSERARSRESRMTPAERTKRRFVVSTAAERSETAKRRWASMTTDQRESLVRKISASLSTSERQKEALRNQWSALTPEQRRERTRKAIEARWRHRGQP